MKRHISILASLALVAAGFTACDDDLDEYKVSELSQSTMALESSSTIKITTDNMSKVVLQMTYTADGHELYITNDYDAETALGEGTYTLEISTSSDFSSSTTKTLSNPIKGANDITYTGQALNILASSLGLEADKEGKIYFRVAHSYTSDSMQGASYSDPLEITVVPIYIDMTRLFIWNSDLTAITDTIYSPEATGVYEGFIGTYGGWSNFWAQDGLQQYWGNYGEDGNFARIALKTNGAWNFWTAEPAGCIFLNLNTNSGSQYITYTNLADLSVTGGATASLSFDVASCQWLGAVTTTTDDAKLTLSGNTLANDNGTGADKASAREGTMTFSANEDGTLELNSGSQNPITIATAGTYKLVIDLSSEVYTYKVSTLGDVKTYPSVVVAKAGNVELTLTAELSAGMATGLYTGTIENATAGAELSFVDGDGNAVGKTATLDNASKYNITLNLATDELTVEEITFEIAQTLGLYYDANYEYIQGTFYSGYNDDGSLNGVYQGLFYKGADDWNFFAKDANGVTFGVNNSTWEQFSFLKGATANFWVSSVQTPYLYSFDVNNETWSETAVESIALTGDWNGWSLDNTFTDNGDGTWSLTDVTLIDESWGPYLVLNGNWDLKLFLAADGTSLTTVNTGNFFATSGAGTYDITINALTNSATITKK